MRCQDEPHFTDEETEARGRPSRLHCIAGRTPTHSGKSPAAFSFLTLAITGKCVNPHEPSCLYTGGCRVGSAQEGARARPDRPEHHTCLREGPASGRLSPPPHAGALPAAGPQARSCRPADSCCPLATWSGCWVGTSHSAAPPSQGSWLGRTGCWSRGGTPFSLKSTRTAGP